jgi:uncharacterized repeat protein (TIGR01451 family)
LDTSRATGVAINKEVTGQSKAKTIASPQAPPSPSAAFSKDIAAGSPNPPTLNQTFSYELAPSNDGNVPLDAMAIVDTLPVQLQLSSVTTGAYSNLSDFSAGVGVRVSYEKNTAPGVFTLWGSSPNATTNSTLTTPPPGLGAGEYVTRVRYEFGQAATGMIASTRPLVTGRITNPDNAGSPVAFGDTIQNCAALTAVYTAGPTNVNRNSCNTFTLSGPFVQLNPAKENLSGGGPFNAGQTVNWRLRVRSAPQSSDPAPLANLVATDLLPVNLLFTSWTFDDQGTGLPAPQSFEQIPNFAGTGRTLLRWRWNPGSGSLGVNQQVWINAATSIGDSPSGPTLSNDFTIDSHAPGLSLRCSGNSEPDSLDLDGDGDTTETLCSATGTINVNRPPTVTPTTAAAKEGDAAQSFMITVNDPDGNMVSITAITQPNIPGATLTCPNGLNTPAAVPFSCTLSLPALSFTSAGFYTAGVSASDGGATTNQTINITVGNVNRSPVLAAILNQKLVAGQTINVPLSATDPDPEDTNITFSVTNVTPSPVGVTLTPSGANTSGNLQIVVAANAQLQTLTVTVTANDNDAVTPQAAGSGPLTGSRQFTISVFSFLIIDDATGMILAFDVAGNYKLIDCRKGGVTLATGVGTVTTNSCKMNLLAGVGKFSTQSVNAVLNTCTKVASATVVVGGKTYTLNDANVANDVISCP